MIKTILSLSAILATVAYIICSCSNDDAREPYVGSDILLEVNSSEFIVKSGDATVSKAIEAELVDSVSFTRYNVYEMLLEPERRVVVYERMKDYENKKSLGTAHYKFATDSMFVNYAMGDKNSDFRIGGPYGNVFYQYFMPSAPTDNNNVVTRKLVQAYCGFSLFENYTEVYQKKYPNAKINDVQIKTDLIIMRAFETR